MRERMSAVDTAWLRMDSDKNLMMIVGVYEFDRKLDFARLSDLLRERLVTHLRFRSRVVRDATGSYWQEVAEFDLNDHLVRTKLPGRGTEADLKRLVGELASQPLDESKPLWQMQLIDNYAGGQALVVRIHHCIADGIALIGVLLALTTDQSDRESGFEATAPSRPQQWRLGRAIAAVDVRRSEGYWDDRRCGYQGAARLRCDAGHEGRLFRCRCGVRECCGPSCKGCRGDRVDAERQ